MHELLKQNPEIWDLFTRKEEYSPEKLDEHGRFTCAYNDIKAACDPHVSRYLVQQGLELEFPENKSFAVCLTHDVDDIYPPFIHSLLSTAHCLKNFDLQHSAAQLLWRFRGKEYSPYLNLDKIMHLEASYNAKSSFYCITAKLDPVRFRYDIEDMKSLLGEVSDNGWEIGLHGGYYSYNNLEEIKTEKERLENVLGEDVIGFRNHYLRFKTPESWEILKDAGFYYDSTFGYYDCIGFRNGMCHPFIPYNLNTGQEIEILEIPLCIMDTTLFNYMHLDFKQAWEYTKNLIDTTEKLNGVITLLWHNFVFSCNFREDWMKLYEKILQYCSEKGAWLTSGEEIYRWWENRA